MASSSVHLICAAGAALFNDNVHQEFAELLEVDIPSVIRKTAQNRYLVCLADEQTQVLASLFLVGDNCHVLCKQDPCNVVDLRVTVGTSESLADRLEVAHRESLQDFLQSFGWVACD